MPKLNPDQRQRLMKKRTEEAKPKISKTDNDKMIYYLKNRHGLFIDIAVPEEW